jgi:Ni/Fe-hydrogenase 1 B-type cytochrome subunit
MLERVKVWEAPVRILHWVHAASILVLGITGLYIGYPFLDYEDIYFPYLMGTVRFIHFSAAFIFGAAFIVRAYWFIRGNHYEKWRAWFPSTRRRWREFGRMLKYYLILERERPNYIGVNPIAGFTYLILGILIFIQSLTGLALFSLPFPSGFWHTGFGWIITLFGAQLVRLVHHVLLWFFVTFFMLHIYLAVLDDIEEKTGGLVSIITGEKYERAEETDE